jgi:hypothetical protein
MTLLSGDFLISNNDVFDDILSCLNTDDLELVPCVTSASVASGKENRCQNQFNQVNSVQNITSNSVPFMALPSNTNYGNITINYNIKNKKKTTKGLQKEENN